MVTVSNQRLPLRIFTSPYYFSDQNAVPMYFNDGGSFVEKYTCVHVFGQLINSLISGRMIIYSAGQILSSYSVSQLRVGSLFVICPG